MQLKSFYISNYSHFKKTPSIDLLRAHFINHLTSCETVSLQRPEAGPRVSHFALNALPITGVLGLLWL